MAVPGPGHPNGGGGNGGLHNVLFYVPQQHQQQENSLVGNEICQSQHQYHHHHHNTSGGGTLNHLSYMQTSHNRYQSDVGSLNKHCFPTDNPFSSDRDTSTGSYWSHQPSSHQQHIVQQPLQQSYQQQHQHQQQYNQWSENDFCQDVTSTTSKSCWQRQPHQSVSNSNCMGYGNVVQQQQQIQHHHQQQQQQLQQHQQYSYQRNNLVATVTVQSSSTGSQSSRTPSRCDSVRSEACESNCSSISSNEEQQLVTVHHQQQYCYQQQQQQQQQNYYAPQQYVQQQQQQQQQQQHHHQLQEQQQQQQQHCFWPSHYEVQQQQQLPEPQHHQPQQHHDYFRQQQSLQVTNNNCYWPRSNPSSPEEEEQPHHVMQHQQEQQQQQYINSCTFLQEDTNAIPCSSTSSSPEATAAPSSDEMMIATDCPSTSSSVTSPVEATTTTPGTLQSPTVVAPLTPPAEQEDHLPPAACSSSLSTGEILTTPEGWTRDVSGGSVTYISPSGYRLRSLADATAYVQQDGTCKCGLPCPLQLQRVFNFDPAVPCNAATSLLDASQTANSVQLSPHRPPPFLATRSNKTGSSCCHRVPLDASEAKEPAPQEHHLPDPHEDSAPPAVQVQTTPPKPIKRKKTISGSGVGGSKPAVKVAKILPAVAPVQQPSTTPLPAHIRRTSPCPNVDVRQIPLEQNRPPTGSLLPQPKSSGGQSQANNAGPTFFEDPSAYLAQQTVLLQSSLSQGQTSVEPPPQPVSSVSEPQQSGTIATSTADESGEELLGDLLDCIPDSMEEVLDRQKDVAAAAEAAAQAEKAANLLIKQAAAQQAAQQATAAAAAAAAATTAVAVVVHQQQSPPKQPKQEPATRSKPPPLAIRPATPATAAAKSLAPQRAIPVKSAKSKSPRRTTQHQHHHGHHQPIQMSVPKMLQPAQQASFVQQQQQHLPPQQQPQFWPAISTMGPLRTTSFPFATYQHGGQGQGTPIFSTAMRPGNNLPMTFLSTSTGQQAHGGVFSTQSLPLLTTRSALGPSGQLVHVLTSPGPTIQLTTPTEQSVVPTVPILAVGPMNNTTSTNSGNRGLTRTGKKRKSSPQTVASILQQTTGAQLTAAAMTQQHHPTTLTLSQDQSQPSQLVYNVQNYQQIQPQPQPTTTIQTLALMPDGKTYVVVNSSPGQLQTTTQHHHPSQQTAQQQNTTTTGHWLLSPRPSTGLSLAPAGQPSMQPVNVTNISGLLNGFSPTTTFVLGGTGGHQVLQLQDGTLLQTTAPDQSGNLLTTNYGGLFIRCPPTQQQPASHIQPIFSPTAAPTTTVRTLQPVPIAPGRSPGRSPDSSSTVLLDGSVNSNASLVTSSVACGEATPPCSQPSQQHAIVVRTAHPSPVVQSSQIDSCVQEVDDTRSSTATTTTNPVKTSENNNNNVQQQQKQDWLNKPASNNSNVPVTASLLQIPTR